MRHDNLLTKDAWRQRNRLIYLHAYLCPLLELIKRLLTCTTMLIEVLTRLFFYSFVQLFLWIKLQVCDIVYKGLYYNKWQGLASFRHHIIYFKYRHWIFPSFFRRATGRFTSVFDGYNWSEARWPFPRRLCCNHIFTAWGDLHSRGM